MIIPTKELDLDDCVLGHGAVVLKQLYKPLTVTQLRDRVRKNSRITSFHRFSLVLTFLFMLKVVRFENGLIIKKTKGKTLYKLCSDLGAFRTVVERASSDGVKLKEFFCGDTALAEIWLKNDRSKVLNVTVFTADVAEHQVVTAI